MKVIVKAQTKKAGNFQIIFENYESADLFLSEVLKHLQFAELQNLINSDASQPLFANITQHYNTQYNALENMVFYCENENGIIYSDYCGKNRFEVEKKLS